MNTFHDERAKAFHLGGSFTARVIFLDGLAGQQRPHKGHAVADADGAHVQGERVERVCCLIGIVAVRGDGIENDEGWRPGGGEKLYRSGGPRVRHRTSQGVAWNSRVRNKNAHA